MNRMTRTRSVLLLCMLSVLDHTCNDAAAQETERASVNSFGIECNRGTVNFASLDHSGEIVVFASDSTNLSSDGLGGIFVRNRRTGMTTRAVASEVSQPSARVSGNGRFVVFTSYNNNLVPGDNNGDYDVFLYDLKTQIIKRVSVDSFGIEGDESSFWPSISFDGSVIAFQSSATNLVPGDTNSRYDVFVHDTTSGSTARVSVTSAGVQGTADALWPCVSPDGRFVSFSTGSALVGDDTNGAGDVFRHDRVLHSTTRVSVRTGGRQTRFGSLSPKYSAVSEGGRYVVFDSLADNLVAQDTNATSDVFMHDCDGIVTTRVSVDSGQGEANNWSEGPTISADGRFIAFRSAATNLTPWDGNLNNWDTFVHDQLTGITELVSMDSSGNASNQDGSFNWATISGDGSVVAFSSEATNLVTSDTNGYRDVFVHNRSNRVPLGGSVVGYTDGAVFDVYVPTRWGGRLVIKHSAGMLGPIFDPEGMEYANGADTGLNKHGWYRFQITGATHYLVRSEFTQQGEAEFAPWNFWYFPIDSSVTGPFLFDTPGAMSKFDAYFGLGTVAYDWQIANRKDMPGVEGNWGYCGGASIASILLRQPQQFGSLSQDELEGIAATFFCNAELSSPLAKFSGMSPTIAAGEEVDSQVHGFHEAFVQMLAVRKRAFLADLRQWDGTAREPEIWFQAVTSFRSSLSEDANALGSRSDKVLQIITKTRFVANDDFYDVNGSTGDPRSSSVHRREQVAEYLVDYDMSGDIVPNGSIAGNPQNWRSLLVTWKSLVGPVSVSVYAPRGFYDVMDLLHTFSNDPSVVGDNPNVRGDRLHALGLRPNGF